MSLSTSTRFLLQVLEDLSTPLSLGLAIRLRHGDMVGILAVKVDPRHYIDAQSYFRDAQAVALFSKRRDIKLPEIDRRAAALTKWWQGEAACYKSNERLARFSFPEQLLGKNEEVILGVIQDIRKTILSWIGPRPPSLDHIEGRFGPGATYSDRGRLTTVPDKMSSTPTLTHHAFWYTLPYLTTKWGRVNQERGAGLTFVRGNKFQVVPKTALIDRCIAIEPAINIFYQLGLGGSLRRRLQKATGWDLSLVSDIHRKKACEGSISGEWATIDLTNASDTVCYELVRLVMPPKWFEELEALRSPFTYVDGHWVKLEKFSSMGNGFTFELETLIFAAISATLLQREGASGLLGNDLFVFGDDIIVPAPQAKSVVAALAFFGFTTNKSKTFIDDITFRESCGGDYFLGVDVRPYFLKEAVNEPLELFPCINGIRRVYKTLQSFGQDFRYTGWHSLIDCLPADVKSCRGPESLGDTVIHDEPSNWRFKWRHGIRYFRGVVRRPQPVGWEHWRPDVVLASALYGVGQGHSGVVPRDSPYVMRFKWIPSS